MATDDFNAHGWAGQVFSDKDNRKRLDHTIKADVLDEMIRQQEKHLQDLLRLRGEIYNPTRDLCEKVGIHKKFLAYGLVLQHKGNISIKKLAQRLNVSRSTIYRHWPEVVRAIKAM